MLRKTEKALAEELKTWNFRDPGKHVRRYDWDKWMNGKPWRLTRGTREQWLAGAADFTVPVRNFQQMAIGYANRHRKDGIAPLWTEIVDDNTIIIQSVREEE